MQKRNKKYNSLYNIPRDNYIKVEQMANNFQKLKDDMNQIIENNPIN